MPNIYELMEKSNLKAELDALEQQCCEVKSLGLSLDMARGKPSAEQVALSDGLLSSVKPGHLVDEGMDAANYGGSEGLPSARQLGAEILGRSADTTIVSGSSSLHLMFDAVSHAYIKGVNGVKPQSEVPGRKFLCPSPGYDRHFAITEYFGYENIAIAMGREGPDMDEVCRLVEGDPDVKGIWCVPKYSNPTGVTYSDEVVRRFAELKPAASDFRIYWDNAYLVHDIYAPGDELLNIFDVLPQGQKTNLVYEFASTSKITIPGAGIAFLSASPEDIADLCGQLSVERVCPDKINQLAHVNFLRDKEHVVELMARHAEFLRPRFDVVFQKLEEGLAGTGLATWTRPRGGYFISFDGPEGSAQRIVAKARELGVVLTSAGATWPYGKDPLDTNIRLAPSYPSVKDLSQALDVFVLCVKLVSAQIAWEQV